MRQKYKYSTEILPDVFCITLPLPGRKPGPVNVYLFKGDNDISLIDTGTKQTAGILKKALKEHGLAFSDINQIIITHGHGDHFGAAKMIARGGSAHVIVHAEDRALIEKGHDILTKKYKQFLKLMNIPRSVGMMLRLLFVFFKRMADNCNIHHVIQEGDEITIGRYRAKIIETPGHSKGSICVYLEKDKILFCGDTIIQHITPNAFIMMDEKEILPVRLSQNEFYKSLARIKELAPLMIHSAHGKAISGVDEIVAGYEKAFAERKENVLSFVHSGENNVYRIARLLFPEIGGLKLPLEIFLSISEVYTTIQILQKEKKVSLVIRNGLLEVHETVQ